MITQYRDGSSKPSRTVLKLLQNLVEGDATGHQQILTEWENELLKGLRAVDPKVRRRAGAALHELVMIISESAPATENPPARMPDHAPARESSDVILNNRAPNSVVADAVRASGAAALRVMRKEEANLRSGRSRGVGGTSGDKSGREPGAGAE